MVKAELTERYCNVYFPSKADKIRWENLAKEKNVPLSKFIFETVEASLDGDADTPRPELAKELAQLREENRKLRDELKLKTLVLDKYEAELYKLRYDAFSKPEDFDGVRRHDEELIAILKRGRTLDGYEILKELGIDPKDSEAVKVVSNQLENLRRFGLADETPNGWKWRA
jgi:hypothetical protein